MCTVHNKFEFARSRNLEVAAPRRRPTLALVIRRAPWQCAFIRAVQEMVDSAVARTSFELANSIKSVASVDTVFRYDHEKQQELLAAKPWEKE